jgi:hypothetical protein
MTEIKYSETLLRARCDNYDPTSYWVETAILYRSRHQNINAAPGYQDGQAARRVELAFARLFGDIPR